ncbi:phosphate ABC transporter substrate-binding protein [Aliikangiella sp. IMCC44653]
MKILQNFLIVTCLLGGALYTSGLSAEVAVIVHPSNANNLSADDIKRIFLGKMKKYPNGSSVLPVNQDSSSAARDEFNDKVLGKSASQVKAYWSKLVFSGKGSPPKEASNQDEVIQLVKDNQSVIGYVDASKVDPGVKVVAKF